DPAPELGLGGGGRRGQRAPVPRVPRGVRARAARTRRMSCLPYLLSAWLFLVGFYGVVTSRHLVHLAVCLTVMQSSTYVLLLAIGYRRGGTAPIFKGIPLRTRVVDPVVQALTLTDVVVSVVVLALVLALAMQAHRDAGTADPDRLHAIRG